MHINRFVLLGALVLTLLMVSRSTLTFAEDGLYIDEAQALKEIGVFKGSDLGFELLRQPTRIEALVMMIRLLGNEETALTCAKYSPVFFDVPN